MSVLGKALLYIPLLWLFSVSAFAGEVAECTEVDCVYSPIESDEYPEPEMTPFPGCACIELDGCLSVHAKHLRNLNFSPGGLATLHVAGGRVAYVRRDGGSAWSHPFDNGADPFAEGLSRTVDGTKIGFINEKLDIVIEPVWDFAHPFERGLALVCEGCRKVTTDARGEHVEIQGGRWGYIDKRGQVVVPVSFPRELLPDRTALPVAR